MCIYQVKAMLAMMVLHMACISFLYGKRNNEIQPK